MSRTLVFFSLALLLPAVLQAQDKKRDPAGGSEVKAVSGISIVGNNEAPKSLYIVPWQASELGGDSGLTPSLLDARTACFEVAGDCFDIINLDGGNAVIVVGDVSGKGADSAMIMANLQASIRVGVEISENFPDFIYRINNHFYSNTFPSEFITFFMGIWEPSKRKLHFINAGHNPPLLIDKNNKITRLFTSGLILGVLPVQKYKKKVITLQRGSVLVLFSDGLDEAMNPQNETFGENRIIKAVMESKDLSSAEIISKGSGVRISSGAPYKEKSYSYCCKPFLFLISA